MNLYTMVQASHGSRVRRAGIVRRRNNLNSTTRLYQFLGAYADETTKEGYVAPEEVEAETEEGYLRAIAAGRAPLRPEIDFLPSRAKINVFGRASRSEIYRDHRIEDLSDAERLQFLRDWWTQDTENLPTKAHHVVFTLDPRLAAAMGQAGVSADSFLVTAVGNAFKEFEARFYPGDLLAYMVALHHDRAHIHAHVLVHPLTQNGSKVNLSVSRRCKVGDTYITVPNQQVLKDAFEHEAQLACDRYLPQADTSLLKDRELREETAEELLLLARVALEPDAKVGGKISLAELVRTKEIFLGDPQYPTLIRQGQNAEAHLIAEDIASGCFYAVRHNFGEIADRLAKAQAESTAQARAALGIFSVTLEKASMVFVEGMGSPLPHGWNDGKADPVGTTISLFSDCRSRARRQREWREENDRLVQEVALLRASLLKEDETETECAIAAVHTVLRIVETIAPTLGEEPDILTLWTPAPGGRPRLTSRETAAARLDRGLTEASSELAARHEPLNVAAMAPTPEPPPNDAEIETYEIVQGRPSFLARPCPITVDELLTLTPLDRLNVGPLPGIG